MRKHSISSATLAAAAMSAFAAGGSAHVPLSDGTAQVNQQPADRAPAAPKKRKVATVNDGGNYRKWTKAYCGKRYRASVRQHQRAMLKAKNRKRSRA